MRVFQKAACTDKPLGRVKLPWLHSVAVIVLKFMVIVVIAFAHGEDGEE
jgi:hypothetical protein